MQTGGTTQAGAAGYVTIDDEHAGDGRPVPPPSATGAFFWGSDSAGWPLREQRRNRAREKVAKRRASAAE